MGLTRMRKKRAGMAMVEMVFVLPLLLLVLFGIAQIGLMFNRWLTLTNAVREGAREGVTWQKNCLEGDVRDRVKAAVRGYAAAGDLVAADLVIADTDIEGECGGSGSDLTVTARYNFKFPVPVPGLLADFPLEYSSTMRNE